MVFESANTPTLYHGESNRNHHYGQKYQKIYVDFRQHAPVCRWFYTHIRNTGQKLPIMKNSRTDQTATVVDSSRIHFNSDLLKRFEYLSAPSWNESGDMDITPDMPLLVCHFVCATDAKIQPADGRCDASSRPTAASSRP